MPTLTVLEPGMFTTIQDLGRHGHASMGVPPSGAADAMSLKIGNRQLGNPDGAAGLECTLLGPTLVFDSDTWICLVGAPCPDARVEPDSRPIAMNAPTRIRRGEAVRVGGMSEGSRACLCVAGGVDVPLVLGSRSTLVGSSLGGFEGRPLREGDEVPVLEAAAKPRWVFAELTDWISQRMAQRVLRVIPSLHSGQFPGTPLHELASRLYVVSQSSNRVGVRLRGDPIQQLEEVGEMESEPTVTGGIQSPGDGQPIVLGVDRPTTGGYPLLACVIEADLPVLGRLRPRDTVRIEVVDLAIARRLSVEQTSELDLLLPPSDWVPS